MTNPLGMMPNEYALDTPGEDGGMIDPPPLHPGPNSSGPDGLVETCRIAGVNTLV